MQTVYLAGPISGLNFAGCTSWRDYAEAKLDQHGIKGLSPMRCKEFLSHLHTLSGHGKEYADLGVLATSRGVMTRDRFDATRCDVLLVNLLGAKTVSIGTMMEVAWADLKRTPIICVMEKEGNVHEHMMLAEAIGYRVETLDEAIELAAAILV
jgi:nucleoside 2-deoxyribosyltransferase